MKKTLIISAIAALLLHTSVLLNGEEANIELHAVTASGKQLFLSTHPESSEAIFVRLNDERFTLDDPIVDIIGIERLRSCRSLAFIITPQIKSYDFLGKVPWIRTLFFTHCRIHDIDFLQRIEELRSVVFEMCRGDDGGSILGSRKSIDLSGVTHLREIGFIDCGLRTPPRLENAPESLEKFDISYNELNIDSGDASALSTYATVGRVIVTGNNVSRNVFDRFPNFVEPGGGVR